MSFEGIGFGREPLAAYACHPGASRGRLIDEPKSRTRTPFQRDRDRIIHSTAFRRLKHKTQVFVYHEGDHYRTRLTHTIEVAQIARAIARALRLDEDLAEALALAHDLGHAPFSHVGEDVLDERFADFGGFDHNAQSLRIVHALERRYADFDGLNLTWELLEGLVKHNGPLTDKTGAPVGRYKKKGLPLVFQGFTDVCDLQLWSHASLEAQAAAIADDIAYNAHDVDDGLRAGFFSVNDLAQVPYIKTIIDEVRGKYPMLDEGRTGHEIVRRMITYMVEDVITNGISNLKRIKPGSVNDVREAGELILLFTADYDQHDKDIKAFLFPKMYRHPDVVSERETVSNLLRELTDYYLEDPLRMPDEWSEPVATSSKSQQARQICDYLAGMTDRFVFLEHARLFD